MRFSALLKVLPRRSHIRGLVGRYDGRMRTLTLRNMQQPSYLDTLLYSLVMGMRVLPPDAYPVRQCEKLPPRLKEIVETNTQLGKSWGCWTDDRGHWLFIASLPLTRGTPVLHLNRYDAGGNLRDTGHWCCDHNDQWQRTSAPRHLPEDEAGEEESGPF